MVLVENGVVQGDYWYFLQSSVLDNATLLDVLSVYCASYFGLWSVGSSWFSVSVNLLKMMVSKLTGTSCAR